MLTMELCYFVTDVFKHLATNFVSERPDDDALLNFCTVKRGTFNCPRGLQLPERFNTYQCTFT